MNHCYRTHRMLQERARHSAQARIRLRTRRRHARILRAQQDQQFTDLVQTQVQEFQQKREKWACGERKALIVSSVVAMTFGLGIVVCLIIIAVSGPSHPVFP